MNIDSWYLRSVSTFSFASLVQNLPSPKRIFDVSFALLILPLVFPIITVLYVLICRDGGPGFFGHERVGKNGRIFKCWKLRSMVKNSQQVLEEHLANNKDAAAEWNQDFKLTDDPRITPFGLFLRQTSLDELPQIWNVLKGEMSFVGPRPVTLCEMPKYKNNEWCYLSERPGITGMWQVSGRNAVCYEQRVQMDVQYSMTRTFLGDLGIIMRTAGAVIQRNGR